MKKFLSENWYKLMIGSSMLMASFGFMVHSISPAHAEESYLKENTSLFSPNSSDALPDVEYWVAYNGYAYKIQVYGSVWKVTTKIKLELGARTSTSTAYGAN